MVLEHALLSVRPGSEHEFEDSFARAKRTIAAMPDFRSLSLSRRFERPNGYLLLVEWEHLEDHTDGLRGSPEYQRWRPHLAQGIGHLVGTNG